nr:reverse transcriptase domain-containing protein [Tanacetum cinerariifolium]
MGNSLLFLGIIRSGLDWPAPLAPRPTSLSLRGPPLYLKGPPRPGRSGEVLSETFLAILENKVAFATGTLTIDALSWWNAYAQPIGIEQAHRITWTELKRLLTNKYCPRTEIKKMEDEFYNLSVKGNDLKTYVRRFQELAILCPNMVPNNEKLMEVFISELPRCIKGNVNASKPQTLEEAINIAQRLMDQVTKHNLIQETNDHKRKFEDKRNISSKNNYRNNYQNIRNNRMNDSRQQQNRRPKTFRSYAATPTENHGYTGNRPLCQRCTLHHTGPCTIRCRVCNKVKGKQEKDKIRTKPDKNEKRGEAEKSQKQLQSSDFLPSPECDSVLYEDFFEVDALTSTNNEDKVFNPGILIHENLDEVTNQVTPDKNVKKISISNASLIIEDFNPPLYEISFHKEVPELKLYSCFHLKMKKRFSTLRFSLLKEFILLFSWNYLIGP